MPVQRSGQSSRDNPLVNTHDYYKEQNTASRGNMAKAMFEAPPMKKEEMMQQQKQMTKQVREQMPPRNNY